MRVIDRVVWAAVAVALTVLVSPRARAADLLNTLKDNNIGIPSETAWYIHTFPPAPGFAGDDLREAVAFFVPGGVPWKVDAVVVHVAARFNADQRLTLALHHSDGAGFPGNVIDSWTVNNLPVRPDGVVEANRPLTTVPTPTVPPLTAGKYWLSLSTPDVHNFSDIYWYNNENRTSPSAMWSAPLNGNVWHPADTRPPQARIIGTQLPEPGAAMLLLGVVGMTLPRKRR